MSGHVYRADTGAPLPDAIVTLTGSRAPTAADETGSPEISIASQSSRTGPDGAFNFASLQPGTYYQITAQHGGYFVRGLLGRSVRVDPGQSVGGVDITLQLAGAVSGSVHDQNNAPLQGLMVNLLCERQTSQGGNPIPSGTAMTDDQGNFRIFGVAPGRCYVLVRASPGVGPRDLPQLGFHTTYYPNADSLDEAQTVQVKAESETPDIGFKIAFAPVHTVRIKVIDNGTDGGNRRYWAFIVPSGERAPRAVEMVMGRFPTLVSPDGTAELKGITAGTYRISVTRAAVSPNGGTMGGGPTVAEADVQIQDSDTSVEIPIPANR